MRFATLPMYDWPEVTAETDAEWWRIRDRALAIDSTLDLPELRSAPLNAEDLARDPNLVFSQTCWGPLSKGLIAHVRPLAQPDYADFAGGRGPFYRSAIIMRVGEGDETPVPTHPGATFTPTLLAGRRLAYNSVCSLSGFLCLEQDLGGDPQILAAASLETGSHRASVIAVAQGRADIAAIDCRSWALARRFEPCANDLTVVGWTSERMGLPYVTSRATDAHTAEVLKQALQELGCHPAAKGGKE